MKDIVTKALYACGWDILEGETAIAQTGYATCNGVNLAHAYLSGRTLNFQYESEGRNIIEHLGLLLPDDENIILYGVVSVGHCDQIGHWALGDLVGLQVRNISNVGPADQQSNIRWARRVTGGRSSPSR